MELYIENYALPVSPDVMAAIQEILRQQDPFCASFNDIDCYDFLTFRQQKAHHGTRTFALLDRNVLVDVLSLVEPTASGQAEKCSDRARFGAAVMCFLQSCNAIIDPSFALYENPDRADEDLVLFRRADNVEASIYARIAIGVLDGIHPSHLPAAPKDLPTPDWKKPITYRQKLRIAALKAAEIDLTDRSQLEKMEEYLRWTFEHYIFIPPAVLLAATHFTPQRTGAVLKSLRSADRAKALAGVDNAVWDLHLLLHWIKRTKEQAEKKQLWVLCSRDSALRQIARALHAGQSKAEAVAARRKFYVEYWGDRDGNRLTDLSDALDAAIGSPTRRVNGTMPSDYLDKLERQLEATFLSFRPKP